PAPRTCTPPRKDAMTGEETIEKMIRLRMPHMAHAFRDLLNRATGSSLSLEEGVGLLIDREWTERENRSTARRLKDARLGQQACLEDFWCEPTRGLDKSLVRSFATCQWVRSHHNLIVIGATGTGKSYLAAALAEAACRRGFRALRVRAPRFLGE